MKSFLRLLVAGVLLAPAALLAATFEGKISFKVTSGRDQGQEMSYSIKGEKMRMEMSGKNASGGMIIDTKKREMLIMMDSEKMYMTMTMPDSAKEAVEKRDRDVKMEKTDVTEKILGYTATKYLVTDKTSKSEVWLAEGLGTFMGMSNRNPMAGGRGAGSAAPGWERALEGKELFPLRIVGLDKAGKENSRMEVTAINKETLPDSLFTPPANYQKFDMGGMMRGLIPGLGR